MRDIGRYLALGGKTYYYKRRVPGDVAALDRRAPVVEKSLSTRNFESAIAQRNIQEKADDAFWAALRSGNADEIARAAGIAFIDPRHLVGLPPQGPDRDFALKPVLEKYLDLLDTDYAAAEAYFDSMPTSFKFYVGNHLVQKQVIARKLKASSPVVKAAIGVSANVTTEDLSSGPTLRHAYERWLEGSGREEMHSKSPGQRKTYLATRERAVKRFCEVVGNLHIFDIKRAQAVKFKDFWRERIYPSDGSKPYKANSANKEIGFLRKLWRDTAHDAGRHEVLNPFAELGFEDKTAPRDWLKSYDTDWLESKWLHGGDLARTDAEVRRILFVMIETGTRPSEVFNLSPDRIRLDDEVPHIRVWSQDGEDPIEIKTRASHRDVPLVGVALAAMKHQPHGFPKYKDKSGAFSAAANKFLRSNGLKGGRQTVRHLRDTYIDRLRAAGCGDDLRREIVGHETGDAHVGYGDGSKLAVKRDIMEKIALSFDPKMV